ncbi:unnamed protein product [Rodentolepis nana]|uniref:Reticulon-like protein n=1 Tax=Rodentolepis nana TaxID=102285 RepID=A0A3P7S5F5_RODNA|nr:unnamed protein product [Rodentolepis nana]
MDLKRISLENVIAIWSAANSTENEELIDLCLPTITTNFAELYQKKNFLAKTTSNSLKFIFKRILQAEDLKLQATLEWLNSGVEEADLNERVRDFKTVISTINLTDVTRTILMQMWHSETVVGSIQQCRQVILIKMRLCDGKNYLVRSWIRTQYATHGNNFDGVLEGQHQGNSNRIFVYGWEKSTKSWMISSIPQLQPEISISIRVPFSGESVICGDKVFIFGAYNAKDSLITVDLSSGETFEPPVFPQPRNDYSVAVKDEFIFLFGGHYEGKCLQDCEKLDTLNNTIVKSENMLNLRFGSSALNIPGMGIVVVGGCDRVGSTLPTLRSIEMLIEVDGEGSESKWIEFPPMLKERYRPGVALFQGFIVVAGGDTNFSVEYYPLTAGDQELSQWTFISAIDRYNLKRISLVTFNNRLLLSSFNDSEGSIFELSQDEEPLSCTVLAQHMKMSAIIGEGHSKITDLDSPISNTEPNISIPSDSSNYGSSSLEFIIPEKKHPRMQNATFCAEYVIGSTKHTNEADFASSAADKKINTKPPDSIFFDLIHWKNPRISALVLSLILTLEMLLLVCSIISILSNFFLLLLLSSVGAHFYFRSIGCPEDNPLCCIQAWDFRLSPVTSSKLAQIITTRVNNFIQFTIDLFLIRNVFNSLCVSSLLIVPIGSCFRQFGFLLYGLAYIGPHFNFPTFCILSPTLIDLHYSVIVRNTETTGSLQGRLSIHKPSLKALLGPN